MVSKKTLFVWLLTILYFVGVLYFVDLGEVSSLMARTSVNGALAAVGVVLLAHLFAYLRVNSVLRALGSVAPWSSTFLAFAAGNVTNLALNVIGQSLSRGVVLAEAGVPFGIAVIGTYVERALAAGILFLFSLAGLWVLFDRITIDHGGVGAVLSTSGGIGAAAGVVTLALYRKQIVHGISRSARLLVRLWPSALLTTGAHVAGLAAYLVLLSPATPASVEPISLIAALAIILFVSNLPISFAGFGLRELSAASTLPLVGISSDAAVATALTMGIIYLTVAGLMSAIAMMVSMRRPATSSATPEVTSAPRQMISDTRIIQGLAIALGVLVFFRLRTEVAGSDVLINVNVGDVLVIAALSIICLMMVAGRLQRLFPRYLVWAFALLSVAIALGLFVSRQHGNLGNWAFYTRGFGWLIIIGYASVAAAFARLSGNDGRILLLQTVIITGVTICGLQLLLLLVSKFVDLPSYLLAYPLQGYANNQNAFSFELAITGILLLIGRNLGLFRDKQLLYCVCVGLIVGAIYFTASRTGAVLIALLAVLDLVLTRWGNAFTVPGRRVTLIAAAGLFGAIVIIPLMPRTEVTSGEGVPLRWQLATASLSQASDLDRWNTIARGLTLWADEPVLGAGIGAVIESFRKDGENPQSVHSVYIWFLAEMGIVGAAALIGAALLIASLGGQMVVAGEATRQWGLAILGIMSFMAISGTVQDFFYQRIFWFVLGLAAAGHPFNAGDARSDKIFLTTVAGFGLLVCFLGH